MLDDWSTIPLNHIPRTFLKRHVDSAVNKLAFGLGKEHVFRIICVVSSFWLT